MRTFTVKLRSMFHHTAVTFDTVEAHDEGGAGRYALALMATPYQWIVEKVTANP